MPTPPEPSLLASKTVPTPDASLSSIILRGRSTKPRTPCQDSIRDPSQEAMGSPSDNADNLTRSRAPAARAPAS